MHSTASQVNICSVARLEVTSWFLLCFLLGLGLQLGTVAFCFHPNYMEADKWQNARVIGNAFY